MVAKCRFGYWLAIGFAIGCVLYLLFVILAMLNGGMPPVEPYSTMISIVSYLSIPIVLLLWVVVNDTVPMDRKIFSTGSLALVIVFCTLTAINRYTALTIIPQAAAMGKTEGLQWFQPYGWPSVMAAMEVQAWGFFLGCACICMSLAFRQGRLEKIIFWALMAIGSLCLLSTLGQVLNNALMNMLGIIAWGPGLIVLSVLWARWFRQKAKLTEDE
jgi:hypothetical protein